jgi:hypothetical protein
MEVPRVPESRRTWQPRERRLVSEWCYRTFPNGHVRENQRLGAIESTLQDSQLTEEEIRHLGVFRRWVDALVVADGVLHLIEGKIRNTPGALEQLDLYERLLPLTPELIELRGLPIQKHLVWVIPDPILESLARERGIRVHLFHPAWVDDYLKLLRPRERQGSRVGGLQIDALAEPE